MVRVPHLSSLQQGCTCEAHWRSAENFLGPCFSNALAASSCKNECVSKEDGWLQATNFGQKDFHGCGYQREARYITSNSRPHNEQFFLKAWACISKILFSIISQLLWWRVAMKAIRRDGRIPRKPRRRWARPFTCPVCSSFSLEAPTALSPNCTANPSTGSRVVVIWTAWSCHFVTISKIPFWLLNWRLMMTQMISSVSYHMRKDITSFCFWNKKWNRKMEM